MNDLISGRDLVTGLDNEAKKHGYTWNLDAIPADFTPAALRRSGRKWGTRRLAPTMLN